jgi:hypothetical protein
MAVFLSKCFALERDCLKGVQKGGVQEFSGGLKPKNKPVRSLLSSGEFQFQNSSELLNS